MLALALLLIVAFSWTSAVIYYRAANLLFVLQSQLNQKKPARIPSFGMYEVKEEDRTFQLPMQEVRSRIYKPEGASHSPGIVLVHGIHYLGIDEPRLCAFARSLSSAGIVVFTPEMPELTQYKVVESTISDIATSAKFLANYTKRKSAGVVGISFAGGLALLAAADSRYQDRIGFVAAFGAHDDLTRVIHFYAGRTIRDPKGTVLKVRPHPYGARVIVYSYLEKLFSPEDLEKARKALGLYLHDDHEEARSYATSLSKEGAEKMLRILDPEEEELMAGILDTFTQQHRAQLALVSPHGKLSHLHKPVLLIHGTDDPVVPATETLWLASQIPQSYLRQTLISPVIRHAELGGKPSVLAYIKLIHFLSEVLVQANRLPAKRQP